MRKCIKGGAVLNTQSMTMEVGQDVVWLDDKIEAVGPNITGDFDEIIDAQGKFILPGFIDAHVHFRLTTLDFGRLAGMTEVEFGIAMARLAEDTVRRGFTTVRDTGGDLAGLRRAKAHREIICPRIIHSSLMISQTGGHGDAEGGRRPVPDCACQMRHTAFGIVADGADAVRKAARHLLRDGADFLKIHVSGGVASPSDPLECTQYTADEIRAAVHEAWNRNTYVTAHGYTSEAVQLAIENGVTCIEHGNLIDRETAQLMAARDVTLVPTLVTYAAMDELGERLGMPEANRAKNLKVLHDGVQALKYAKEAGVAIAWGTDLIGETQRMQALEFKLRAEVQTAAEILNSMYVVNPRLLGLSDQIGVIAPGYAADLVVSAVNPLADITALADTSLSVGQVIQDGQLIR